jgi:hypothetical protein
MRVQEGGKAFLPNARALAVTLVLHGTYFRTSFSQGVGAFGEQYGRPCEGRAKTITQKPP